MLTYERRYCSTSIRVSSQFHILEWKRFQKFGFLYELCDNKSCLKWEEICFHVHTFLRCLFLRESKQDAELTKTIIYCAL